MATACEGVCNCRNVSIAATFWQSATRLGHALDTLGRLLRFGRSRLFPGSIRVGRLSVGIAQTPSSTREKIANGWKRQPITDQGYEINPDPRIKSDTPWVETGGACLPTSRPTCSASPPWPLPSCWWCVSPSVWVSAFDRSWSWPAQRNEGKRQQRERKKRGVGACR